MFLRSKQTGKRRAIALLVQIIILISLYLGLRAWMQRDMLDGPAPEFSARDIHGEMVSLNDYRGEPLLLHFWASWCRICKFEQGAVDALTGDWPVLTVAMQSGGKAQVKEFLNSRGLDWPVLVDESGELSKRYGVQGVPGHYIIDKDGQIRFREMGYTTSWGLRMRLWLTRVLG